MNINKISRIILIVSVMIFIIGFLFCVVIPDTLSAKVDNSIIYNSLSKDNYSGSSVDNQKQYEVKVTTDYLYIKELTPKTPFFKLFVKDTTIHEITLQFSEKYNLSNEFHASIAEAKSRLTINGWDMVQGAQMQAHGGLVRLIIISDPLKSEVIETFYFIPYDKRNNSRSY